jgi:histone H3/H4
LTSLAFLVLSQRYFDQHNSKEKKMAKKAKKKERDVLVVASKVREYVKSNDCNTSGEFIGELSNTVYDLIDKAINRAQGNNRKTIQAKDV